MRAAGPSRRSLLATPALLGLAAWAGQADARAPFVGTQVAPWYRRKLGAFELTIVSDGPFPLAPVHPIYGGSAAPAAEVEALLAARRLPTDAIASQTNCIVVNTGAALVLIDTGVGPSRAFGPLTGRLPDNLRAAGIDPATIDMVALTHAHPDHAWGVVNADGSPLCANANYAVTATDFDFWTAESRAAAPGQLGAFAAGTRKALLPLAPRTTMFAPGAEIVPGIRSVAAPGHTPGHVAYHLESEGQRLLVLGDAASHPIISLERPDWPLAFDADAGAAVATRRRLLGMAASDRIEIASYHFPWPGLGQVEAVSNAFRYLPTPWRWEG